MDVDGVFEDEESDVTAFGTPLVRACLGRARERASERERARERSKERARERERKRERADSDVIAFETPHVLLLLASLLPSSLELSDTQVYEPRWCVRAWVRWLCAGTVCLSRP